MKRELANMTRSLRFALIRKLSPSLWTICQNAYIVDIYPKPATLFAKQLFGEKSLNVLEIGVLRGLNAEAMLKTLNITKLYLVDPYADYVNLGKVVRASEFKPDMEKRLKKWWDKIVFIQKTSDDAVDEVPGDLDYVYIDGGHDESQVMRDLTNYSKKLKEGGVLAGHDFSGDYVGLCRAVVNFASENGYELNGRKADFWLMKSRES